MYTETKFRTVLKTFSWRFVATFTTILIVYFFTGRIDLAIEVGAIEVVAKLLVYFLHERAWGKISYGKKLVALPNQALKTVRDFKAKRQLVKEEIEIPQHIANQRSSKVEKPGVAQSQSR